MLTLSPTAATLLSETRSQQAGIPDDATLRVAAAPAQDGEQAGLTLGFVDEPHEGDQTGEAHGLPICVAPDVADALDDVAIDVQQDGDSAQLVIVPAG
jgi:Fe-S cluster assembly iron-binding protein IscA